MVARLRDAGYSDLHEIARDPKLFGECESESPAPAAVPRVSETIPGAETILGLDFNASFADHF